MHCKLGLVLEKVDLHIASLHFMSIDAILFIHDLEEIQLNTI